MATLNRLVTAVEVTHEGAPAVSIPPLAQLERSVMSCLLWESEFYEDGQSIAERIKDLVKIVPPLDVVRVAIQAKEDMRLRHVPLLLTRELMRSKEGRAQAMNLFPRVITRADEIGEFLAIYWMENKDEPLAKQVKRWLGDAFRRFDEYQLAKYNGGSKVVKLRDAIRILRPKPVDVDQDLLWRRLVKGELATPDTWEVELSRSQDKKASWTRLLTEGKLGGLALLRNIRNMTQADVDVTLIRQGIAGISPHRLLPINFLAAAATNVQFEPDLELKFFECFGNQSKATGETIILVDVSGSMEAELSGRSDMKRIDVACALGMIGREMFQHVRIMTFSNQVVEIPSRRGFALRDGLLQSQVHAGTYLGNAIKALPACDRLIVITDEQSHDHAPQRKGGYLINVGSYKNGVGYRQWTHIDGWSDKVLTYILKLEGQADGAQNKAKLD